MLTVVPASSPAALLLQGFGVVDAIDDGVVAKVAVGANLDQPGGNRS